MNKMKNVLNIILDLAVISIILIWGYMLFEEFKSLPVNNIIGQFTIFNIKILLFSLFLICAVTSVFYLNLINERKSSSGPEQKTAPVDIKELTNSIHDLKSFIISSQRTADISSKNPKEDSIEDLTLMKFDEIIKIIHINNTNLLFSDILQLSSRLTNAKRISIFMYQSDKNKLKLIDKIGFSADNIKEIEIQEGLSWYTFKNGKRMYATNIETHPEISRKNKPQYDKKSLMILPIKILKDKTIGVLNLTEKQTENGIFTKNDLELMNFITSILEIKLENIIFSDSIEFLIKKSA